MGKQNIIRSEFFCTQCGNRGLPVWRKAGKERESGHLKKMFCLTCNKEQNFCEVKPFTHYTEEDFRFEFEHGNFSPEGLRILTYGELKRRVYSEES